MDLLTTAVVDITTLVATCRALRNDPVELEADEPRKLRGQLRAQLGRAAEAYIETLARSKRGLLDQGLLSACRIAAEGEMPRALRRQAELQRLMSTKSGVLAGVAAARQDLWRLAHLTMHLRQGVAALRVACGEGDGHHARELAFRMRRRLRRALLAYARTSHRAKNKADRTIAAARLAALDEIGQRGMKEAFQLGQIEARCNTTQTTIQLGLVRSLTDLAVDWRPLDSWAFRGSNRWPE